MLRTLFARIRSVGCLQQVDWIRVSGSLLVVACVQCVDFDLQFVAVALLDCSARLTSEEFVVVVVDFVVAAAVGTDFIDSFTAKAASLRS